MSLITASDVVVQCNLPDYVESKLTVHLATSEKKLIELIGQEKFDLLAAADPGDTDRQDAAAAQSFLTCYYAFPHLALQPNQGGGFTKQTGFEASQNTLMSKGELDKYRSDLFAQALLRLQDLLMQTEDESGNVENANLGRLWFEAL